MTDDVCLIKCFKKYILWKVILKNVWLKISKNYEFKWKIILLKNV